MSKTKLKKVQRFDISNNSLVNNKNGKFCLFHHVDKAVNLDGATIEQVDNQDPDSNEADSYTLIISDGISLCLTADEVNQGIERFRKKPWESKPKGKKKTNKKAE